MTLKITNLSKRYENTWVIRDLSLEIERGKIHGLFGRVGSGKSTLIRSIAGTDTINGGSILFDSVDLTTKSCDERGFHFPSLTNDSFWKSIFNTKNPSKLADGEGQALALEKALENADGLLLIDNQFCFMDRNLRDQKFEQLRQKVREKNVAVIFATNDFEQIFALCDLVSVLEKGTIIQTGAPREIYESPVCVNVASITGKNNLFKARRISSSKADIPEFQTLAGEHRLFTDKVEKTNLGAINQNITLAIRPEHISISFGASFPEDNLIKATIKKIKYQGATTLISLEAKDLVLEALVLRLVGLNIGDECVVGLPPDRILVLRD